MPPKQRVSVNGSQPELREFEFVVQPILLLHRSDEEVPTRVPADPVVLSGLTGLREFADRFQSDLDEINKQLA